MIVLVLAEFVASDWHCKRSTTVGCIARDGNAMNTLIIRDRVTMEDDLQLYGYDARKIVTVSQTKAFMTTALFAQ
jgi:hypothetical protein